MGVAGYNDTEVNRPPEAVSDWSVPAHFGGFCKWLKGYPHHDIVFASALLADDEQQNCYVLLFGCNGLVYSYVSSLFPTA